MAVPIFRISLANATVLSVAYLLMALAIDVARLWLSAWWLDSASFQVAWIPSRTLEWVGLLTPLRAAWLDGKLNAFEVRLILGATGVGSIFAIAVLVGCLMWLGRFAIQRVERRRSPPAG